MKSFESFLSYNKNIRRNSSTVLARAVGVSSSGVVFSFSTSFVSFFSLSCICFSCVAKRQRTHCGLFGGTKTVLVFEWDIALCFAVAQSQTGSLKGGLTRRTLDSALDMDARERIGSWRI